MADYGIRVTKTAKEALTELDPAYLQFSSSWLLFKQITTGSFTVTTSATGATATTFTGSMSQPLGYATAILGFWSTDQVNWRAIGDRAYDVFGVTTQISTDSTTIYGYVTTQNTGALTVYIRWTLYIDGVI